MNSSVRTAFAWVAALCAVLVLACAGSKDVERSFVREPQGDELRHLEALATDFYERISNRRFNSIATYQDPALREFFHTEESFADYYADLAQDLTDAHFEANRPTRVTIRGYSADPPEEGDAAPTRVWVRVRFRGQNARPLRWWSTRLVRDDQWQHTDGRWRIIPGKV